MDIVTIDFETYYDKDYSLSKITTEEYVRSDMFEVIGVSVKINNHEADWYTGDDPSTFLNSIDYSDKAILCHNTFFDGAILSWHFGVRPKLWLDTLSMARPAYGVVAGGSLHKLTHYFSLGTKGTEVVQAMGKRRADFSPAEIEAYGNYCLNDADLTYALFKELRKGFPVSEIMLIDRTIRMYTEPKLVLDRQLLEEHLLGERERKQALIDRLGGHEKARKILNSNAQFAAILGRLGVDVPMKTSMATGKETYAFAKTDIEFTDLLEHGDPRVSALVEARLGTKSSIEETRTQRLIEVSERGPLPVMLNYYGAHTGRYSGGDRLNLQNLPSRKSNTIRRAICAPEGKLILTCDAAQIEARLTGYVAKQDDLTEAFRQGRDVYSEFATDAYGYPVDKSLKVERFLGKTCILGLGYGMGPDKFRTTLESGAAGMKLTLPEGEHKRIVYLYRDKYGQIKSLWDECGFALKTMLAGGSGMIRDLLPFDATGIALPNGMKLTFHGLCERDGEFYYINNQRAWRAYQERVTAGRSVEDIPWTKIYGGKVVENIIQSLARIVVFDQLVTISHRYPVLFQVHDENVVMVDERDVLEAQAFIEDVMSTPPAWAPDLPVACESAYAKNFGDCK